MRTKQILNSLAPAILLASSSLAQHPVDPDVVTLETFVVTGVTRTEKALSTIPQTVTIIPAASLENQLFVTSDPIHALSQLLPAFSPSRQKMTGAGETFRGRNPLFMVDGVPQSNPLRDGAREGYTIDPAMIERIEIIHGASAAQGLGATGGIINYVSYAPPLENGTEQYLETGISSSDTFESKGIGYRGAYRVGYRHDKLALVGAVAHEWRPMTFDGEGRLVGIDNTQGDTMNSRTNDFYGKVTYQLTPNQSVRLFANRFSMEQDLEYVSVPGNHAAGVPTTSTKGATPGKPTQNQVTTAGFTYAHSKVAGGNLTADFFLQDFAATYGGGNFAVFIHDGVRIFDQSQNESQKHGMKLTYARELPQLGNLDVVTGVDYLSDTTRQVLVQTGRTWVPETDYHSWAPYLQLERRFGPAVLSGGVRYEIAELDVGDFTTLEGAGKQFVAGGTPSFEEMLFNLGATVMVGRSWNLYASYSQGFGMADVGRVLRGINKPGQDVDTFLGLEPVVTGNYEAGVRWQGERSSGGFSLFFSDSDLGFRLQADSDGIYSVVREKTETYGVEVQSDYRLTDQDEVGLRFAWVEGESDRDGDGAVDTRLDGTNIPPARLNLSWSRAWTPNLRTRLQTSTYFDRKDPLTRSHFDFQGYTLADLLVSYALPTGALHLGVENLFDRQYITYYSQTIGNNARNFAGRGRSLSLRYTVRY